MKKKANDKKPEMVEWYNPFQLRDTAIKTAISTIIGENADPRLVGVPTTGGTFFDYSKELEKVERDFKSSDDERKEIWIDYVSDVGDGWNPTYSVAYSLARQKIELSDGKSLERGEILIFGGDGVYPTASSDEYEERLVQPYRMAFNASRTAETATDDDSKKVDLKKKPHVFALPGNHDWYDSLVAFQKIFCTHIINKRTFAGAWQTRQKRSYFALKLPNKWWLLGVDLQLSHNIDVPQLEYFESIADQMKPEDKVILCVPEPYWVKAIKYEEYTDVFAKKEESIEKLEKFFEDRKISIKLYLAGDLHHYRRFQSEDGQRIQKITAGGGGAFLHPTHDFDFSKNSAGKEKDAKSFTLKGEYPPADVSRRQDWKNLYGFLWNNKTFGIVTAILYPLLALLIHGEIDGKFHWTNLFTTTFNRLIEEPSALLIVILMLFGLIFFTDSTSKIQKYLGGAIHGLFHLAAVFVLGWLGFFLMLWTLGIDTSNYLLYRNAHPTLTNSVWFFWVLVVCSIGGYIIGSFIMGVYLFISLHLRGRHDNEAFSALKIEDYKNFIRLHIDEDGKLTIYPFKIEKVERDWIDVKADEEIVSRQPKNEIKPELIETIEPIG